MSFWGKKKKAYYRWEVPAYRLPPIHTLVCKGKLEAEKPRKQKQPQAKPPVQERAKKNTHKKLRYQWFVEKTVVPRLETLVPVGKVVCKKNKKKKKRYFLGVRRLTLAYVRTLTPKTLYKKPKSPSFSHRFENRRLELY